jgi:hypothetical protein
LKSTRTGSSASSIGAWRAGAGGREQQRVAGRGVAVDVTQFSDLSAASAAASAARRPGLGVGEDEGQHGRHVGRDHARALEEAVDGDRRSPILAWRVASLGKVSVVMIARGARHQLSSPRALDHARTTAAIFSQSSGWPITPVEAMNTSLRGQPSAWATRARALLDGLVAQLAGEGVGVAGIDQDGRDLAARQFLRHQSTGAD